MATQPSPIGSGPRHVSLVAIPEAAVSTLFGIFDVLNAFVPMRLVPQRRRAVSRRDRWRDTRPPGAGQWRAGQRATGDRHDRDERHRDRAVCRAQAGWMVEGPVPAHGRVAAANVRPRRGPLLGLLRHLPVGGDWAVRGQRRHRAFCLRPGVCGHASRRADSPRAGARDFRERGKSW